MGDGPAAAPCHPTASLCALRGGWVGGRSYCPLEDIPGPAAWRLDLVGVMRVSFFLCHQLGAYQCHGAARGD